MLCFLDKYVIEWHFRPGSEHPAIYFADDGGFYSLHSLIASIRIAQHIETDKMNRATSVALPPAAFKGLAIARGYHKLKFLNGLIILG